MDGHTSIKRTKFQKVNKLHIYRIFRFAGLFLLVVYVFVLKFLLLNDCRDRSTTQDGDFGLLHTGRHVLNYLRRDGYAPRLVSMNSVTHWNHFSESDFVFQVPNVVYFVWFGTDLNFTFINYLSFLSTSKVLKPDVILVFGENVPDGDWWTRTVREVSNLYHVTMDRPKYACNGMPFKHVAHSSDFVRAELLWSQYLFCFLVRLYINFYLLYLSFKSYKFIQIMQKISY